MKRQGTTLIAKSTYDSFVFTHYNGLVIAASPHANCLCNRSVVDVVKLLKYANYKLRLYNEIVSDD